MAKNGNSNGNNNDNDSVRRKVQIVGGNTATVSLPKPWADRNQIGRDQGEHDEIEFHYLPNVSLMIHPVGLNAKKTERYTKHELRDESLDTLKRMILADFIGGIDVIELNFRAELPREMFNALYDFVSSRLIGFELIDRNKTIEIINMTQAPKFSANRLLEIIRVQSCKMIEKSFQWLVDETINNDDIIDRMHRWEIVIDRQTNQMMRTLQLALLDFWIADQVGLPMSEILYWSTVTKSAESVADLAVAIAHLSKNITMDTETMEMRKNLHNWGISVTDLYSRSMKSFIHDDYQESYLVLEEQAKKSITIQKKWPIDSQNIENNLILVMAYLEKITGHARKIAEASIDCEGVKNSNQLTKLFDN